MACRVLLLNLIAGALLMLAAPSALAGACCGADRSTEGAPAQTTGAAGATLGHLNRAAGLAAPGGCPCCPDDDTCVDCGSCRTSTPTLALPLPAPQASAAQASQLDRGRTPSAVAALTAEGPPPRFIRS